MNLDKCIMFKVLLSKVLKSQYFLKAHILVFWIRQWGTCFCRVRCSGGSISLPISRCISLWAHRSVSLHSIVSRTFYFFAHIFLLFAHYDSGRLMLTNLLHIVGLTLSSSRVPCCSIAHSAYHLSLPCSALLWSPGLLVWSASNLAWIAETLILHAGRKISSSLILVFITIVYPVI